MVLGVISHPAGEILRDGGAVTMQGGVNTGLTQAWWCTYVHARGREGVQVHVWMLPTLLKRGRLQTNLPS